MSTADVQSEAAGRKFIDKLNQFRGGLDPAEQRMLDALVAGARKAHAQGDVEGYWLTSGLSAAGTQPVADTTSIWSGYIGMQGNFTNTPFS
jgi:hypothetical protein